MSPAVCPRITHRPPNTHYSMYGHVIKTGERIPKEVFCGDLQEGGGGGERSQDGQKICYKDTLKASLKDFDIPMGLGNRLHRSDQIGAVSSTKGDLPAEVIVK